MKYMSQIEVDFDEYWGRIKRTVQNCITSVEVERSTLEQSEDDISTLCNTVPKQYDERLYVETKLFLTNHVKQLVENCKHKTGLVLQLYQEAWTQYSKGMDKIDKLYEPLNNIYDDVISDYDEFINVNSINGADKTDKRTPVGEMGLEIWKYNMIISFGKNLLDQVFEAIHQDKIDEYRQDSSLIIIRGVIQSFIGVKKYLTRNKMEFYKTTFEKFFLAASGEYYQKESDSFLSEGNMIQYIKKVSELRKEENIRAIKFLDPSSYVPLIEKFDEILISNVLPRLMEECSSMLAEERWSDLSLLYRLVYSVEGGLPPVIKQFEEYIKQRGEIVFKIPAPGPEGPNFSREFLNKIIDFHDKNIKLIKKYFDGDLNFINALDQTFAFFINHNPNPKSLSPYLYSLLEYCDGVLKKSSKEISKYDIEDKLSKAIIIFKYIHDKDLFQKMYKGSLARRLLQRQSQSLKVETEMIDRLKNVCGFRFTKDLKQMIEDTTISADLTNQFNTNIINDNFKLEIDFSIQILQAGTWPDRETTITSLAVPQVLTTSIQMFENFYNIRKFSGRKLTWNHHLSQCELQLTYLDKHYLITMTTFQMAILLLFVNADSLTGKDVQETLQLDSDQFSKNVASLVENKLIKSNTPTILPETVLSLNLEFTNTLTKFKLRGPLKRDIQKEVKQAQGCLYQERRDHINCVIVRIMKARKTHSYTALIQEVLSQPKGLFSLNIKIIKKSIEYLIEKEFIERNPNCPDELNYIV